MIYGCFYKFVSSCRHDFGQEIIAIEDSCHYYHAVPLVLLESVVDAILVSILILSAVLLAIIWV